LCDSLLVVVGAHNTWHHQREESSVLSQDTNNQKWLLPVELGKRFFPRRSEVLDKIMDDDLTDIASFRTENTSEEQRDRYMELQGVFGKSIHRRQGGIR